MQFAGLLIEGGIVGYDSNVVSGGAGARYLGIGAHNEYRVDTVTVVLRLVSVTSGKILLSIATEKSIASQRSGADVFKFLEVAGFVKYLRVLIFSVFGIFNPKFFNKVACCKSLVVAPVVNLTSVK